MLKAELIKALTPQVPNTNILDEPLNEINVPFLKPSQPTRNFHITSIKNLTSKVTVSLNKKINEFSDWVLSYVPEPKQKTVNERVESLKKQINKIFKFIPKERDK